jgi:hypothetical protein
MDRITIYLYKYYFLTYFNYQLRDRRRTQRGTRNVDIYRGVQTTSRESDRNLMAPVCADSFLKARGSTVLEVIALMVGGSK